jgi:hypothetical protein
MRNHDDVTDDAVLNECRVSVYVCHFFLLISRIELLLCRCRQRLALYRRHHRHQDWLCPLSLSLLSPHRRRQNHRRQRFLILSRHRRHRK